MRVAIWLALIIPVMAYPAQRDAHGTALLHPPVDAAFSCTEHFSGQFKSVGDALGTDCVVTRLDEVDGRLWSRAYRGEGHENSDWFGWETELLAPCQCLIEKVHINPVVNSPGIMGSGRASSIVFLRVDGVRVLYAHVRDLQVKEGDKVEEGSVVARIGNNGFSRSPHVHVGAWKGENALQIRWNQLKMKLPPEHRNEQE